MKKVIKLRDYLIVALTGILLIVLGSFFDLKVTNFLYDYNDPSSFGIIFSLISEWPAYLLGGGLSGLILFHLAKARYFKTKYNFWIEFLGIFMLVAFSFLVALQGFKLKEFTTIGKSVRYVIYLVCYIVFIIGIDFLLDLIVRKVLLKFDKRDLLIYAFNAIFLVALESALCGLFKVLASRPRPFYLISNDILDQFKNWFEWTPFKYFTNHYYASFPSGHTAHCGTIFFLLPALINLDKNGNKNKITIVSYYICFIYILLVGLGRISAGYHFLSDVGGGIFLSVSCSFIASQLNIGERIFICYENKK